MVRLEKRVAAPVEDCANPKALMTWRIRVGLIIGLTVVVVGTWGAWWKIEDRKVGGALEALRAAGQPSTIEDFVTEKIPADENAVTFLRQIKVKEAADNLESKPEFAAFPVSEETGAKIDAWVKENAEVIGQVRRAERCRGMSWYDKPEDRLEVWRPFNSLADVREVEQLLGMAAIRAGQRGDLVGAIRYFDDIAFVSRATRAQETMLGKWMADGMDALECDAVRHLAMILPRRAMTAEEEAGMKRIIGDLLDDQLRNQTLLRAVQREKVVMLWYARHLEQTRMVWGKGELPIGGWEKLLQVIGRPYWAQQRIAALKDYDLFASAATSKWVMGKSGTIGVWLMSRGNSMLQPAEYIRYLAGDFVFSPMAHFRVQMDRRISATALAMGAYRMQHGDWPAKLEDLAGEFPKEMVVDPYSPSGGTFGYRFGADPYVYSVFENGKDDTAASPPTRKDAENWTAADFCVYLTAAPAASQPATDESK